MSVRQLAGMCTLVVPLLGGCGSSDAGDMASPSLQPHERRATYVRAADLQKLSEWVSLEQSFSLTGRLEAQRVISELLKNETAFSDAAFYMEVRRITGLADNGHSNVTQAPIHATFGLIPLLLESGAVAYIQLRANIGPADNSVQDFVAEARQRLERDRPHSIILDNRHNRGGDLTRTANFALALPSLASPEGRVYVITGSGTFSAGIYTSFLSKSGRRQTDDPRR